MTKRKEDQNLINYDLEFLRLKAPNLMEDSFEKIEEWVKKAFPEDLQDSVLEQIKRGREDNPTQSGASPKDSS